MTAPPHAHDHQRPPRARLCASCGATPGGCAGLLLLGGRSCCSACTGVHDTSPDGPTSGTAA